MHHYSVHSELSLNLGYLPTSSILSMPKILWVQPWDFVCPPKTSANPNAIQSYGANPKSVQKDQYRLPKSPGDQRNKMCVCFPYLFCQNDVNFCFWFTMNWAVDSHRTYLYETTNFFKGCSKVVYNKWTFLARVVCSPIDFYNQGSHV